MLQAVETMERIDAAHVTGAARTRLQLSLIVNFFLLMPLDSGVLGVLLPNQIAQLSPASKENNLALLFAITSFFSTLATPIAAALSDRTHSRWGRCSPWIAIASLIGPPVRRVMDDQLLVADGPVGDGRHRL
jgi:Na+/melibiose symporter and related transporters